MVENEEIMGSMRSEGDNDPVSEFIGKTYLEFVKQNHPKSLKNISIFIYSSLQSTLHDCINYYTCWENHYTFQNCIKYNTDIFR